MELAKELTYRPIPFVVKYNDQSPNINKWVKDVYNVLSMSQIHLDFSNHQFVATQKEETSQRPSGHITQ